MTESAVPDLAALPRLIDAANDVATRRMLEAEPVLINVVTAEEVIPALSSGMKILHAGPPVDWSNMCGPMQGAVCGIAVFEGWAKDLDSAREMAASGAFAFEPNHHHDAVGPMTGMTTRSQPLMVVENKRFGNTAYCAINEGLGKVLRFGGNDQSVLDRLGWLRDVAGPLLGQALRESGGIDLKHIIARGLTMGDEMHQRNTACSGLLLREMAPALAKVATDTAALSKLLAFMGGNDQFFLNVAMATGKATMDAVKGIEHSSIVVAMSRNGTDFGIRIASHPDVWFTAPVEMPEGLYFPGFTEADANPDMGDSTIVETIGLGGFAMGAAPAVAGFVGAGKASDAGNYTRTMRQITHTQNPEWTIPGLDYFGVPTGIDIRRVVEMGLAPVINTGIAHRQPGVGQVGAGIVRAPLACFNSALDYFAAEATKSMGIAV